MLTILLLVATLATLTQAINFALWYQRVGEMHFCVNKTVVNPPVWVSRDRMAAEDWSVQLAERFYYDSFEIDTSYAPKQLEICPLPANATVVADGKTLLAGGQTTLPAVFHGLTPASYISTRQPARVVWYMSMTPTKTSAAFYGFVDCAGNIMLCGWQSTATTDENMTEANNAGDKVVC